MTAPSDAKMGIWMTGALVVGCVIGSGIFLLPVSLAPLGTNATLGWVISGAGALAIAYSLALISRNGAGIQTSVEESFGPTVAFLVTFSFWCSNWAASAALAIATASAIAWIDPSLQATAFTIPVAVACTVALSLVNSQGARAVGGLSIITVLIKIMPLIAVAVAAGLHAVKGTGASAVSPVPVSVNGLGSAVALTLFALTGFENATAPVDKVRNPSRTIPLALLGGTLFVVLLYLASSSAVLSLLGTQAVAASSSPFADAIAREWGRGASWLAITAIAVAAFGGLNGMILATSELGYSMALRGDLPRRIARTRGAGTPVASVWLTCGITILLILANASRNTAGLFTFVILLSTASVLVVYLIGSLAAWVRCRHAYKPVIAIAVGFSIFALWGTGAEAVGWGGVLLVIGYVLRIAMHAINARVATSPATEAAPAAPLE
jgi:APA family basic amino acid/polyamine antiporter